MMHGHTNIIFTVYIPTHTHIHIYMFVCVCVCVSMAYVCVCVHTHTYAIDTQSGSENTFTRNIAHIFISLFSALVRKAQD